MRLKRLIIVLLLVTLSGCMSHYGHFAPVSLAMNEQMAKDTVGQLVVIYPPAHTRFIVKQAIKDAYGASLLSLLRQKGYSLEESAGSAEDAKALFYVVDSPIKPNLYRVTLMIGHQSLSRAYSVQNNSLYPMGSWVRKE